MPDNELLDKVFGRLNAISARSGLDPEFLMQLGTIDCDGKALLELKIKDCLDYTDKVFDLIIELISNIDDHALNGANAKSSGAIIALQDKINAIKPKLANALAGGKPERDMWPMASTIVAQILAFNMEKINSLLSSAIQGEGSDNQQQRFMAWISQMDTAGQKAGAYWEVKKYSDLKDDLQAQKALEEKGIQGLLDDMQRRSSAQDEKVARLRSELSGATADDALKLAYSKAAAGHPATAKGRWGALRAATGGADWKAWALYSKAEACQRLQRGLQSFLSDNLKKNGSSYLRNWRSRIGSAGIGAGFGEADEYAQEADLQGKLVFRKKNAAGQDLWKWPNMKAAVDYLFSHQQQNHPSLTYAEAMAIVAYTSNLYSALNNQRRANVTMASVGFMDWISVLTKALSKLPALTGLGFRHDGRGAHITQRTKGGYLADSGFFSVALEQDGTVGGANHDVLSLIHYSNGKSIGDYSYYGHYQKEILFPPNTRFLIEDRFERSALSGNWDALRKANPDISYKYKPHQYFMADKKKDLIGTILCMRQIG